MNEPLRYALVGATGIGGYHLAAIREIEKTGAARLVAVADPALERLPDLQADLTAQGASCHLDYRALLRHEPGLDVVVISVPIPLHLEITLACLERDLFIYLEKPPVPLIQQLETMIAADPRGRIGVGFQMITSNWVQTIKRAIVEGKLGRLQDIRIGACWPRLDPYYTRNSSAGKMFARGEPVFDGPATNALAHLLHNAMFLAGAGTDEFDAPVEIEGELYRARPIESYDIACLRGKFRSGLTFSAALTHATEESLPFQMEVRGSDGWARVTQDGALFESSLPGLAVGADTFEQLVEKTHRQFLAFARGEQPRPSTSLPDSRGYVLATNGMLLSSGGVHTIEAPHLRRYSRGDEGGYDAAGLRAAVVASFETGKLFSELDLPWAVPTSPVSVENLKTLALPTN